MTISGHLDKIAQRIVESGMEVPDCAFLGIDAYETFKKEALEQNFSSMAHIPKNAHVSFAMYLMCGKIDIKVKPDLPPNHISIGRITLCDFFIEDILFGEEDIDFSKYN